MSMLSEFIICFNLTIITYHIINLFSLNKAFFIKIWLVIIIIELLFIRWPIFLFIIFILNLLASYIIINFKPSPKYTDYDYLLVLGYVLNNDELNDTLKYRLDLCLKKVIEYPKAKIILSGGISQNNSLSEAQVMSQYLILKGIEKERLILEDKSSSTIENIKNSKIYIDSKRILLISSDYHILRSLLICKKLSLYPDACGSRAPLVKYPNELMLEKYCILRNITKGD